MDLNARVDINCGRKDGRTDLRTENRTPLSHHAKAGATKKSCSTQLRMKFFLLINVKMPRINCWHFNIYEQEK